MTLVGDLTVLLHGGDMEEPEIAPWLQETAQVSTSPSWGCHGRKSAWLFLPLITQFVSLRAQGCS